MRADPKSHASARKAVQGAIEQAGAVGRTIKRGAGKVVDVIRHGPAARALRKATGK